MKQGLAQAQAARAQQSAADVDLNATLIRAAINGRVGDRTVEVGQYAGTGTRLMSLVPLDKLYITANFKETQLALMRPGQPVEIKVDALDGIALKGRVASFSPGTGAQFSLLPPQNATGNFTKITQRVPVRIALEATPQTRRLLVPGLSVEVTVDTSSAKDDIERLRDEQQDVFIVDRGRDSLEYTYRSNEGNARHSFMRWLDLDASGQADAEIVVHGREVDVDGTRDLIQRVGDGMREAGAA